MYNDRFIVYILHFDRPYWQAGKANCQHYVGYTKDLPARLDKHRQGNGSKLVRYANNQGIQWQLVLQEDYPDRSSAMKRELQIKRNGGGKRLCPICRHLELDYKDISAVMQEANP